MSGPSRIGWFVVAVCLVAAGAAQAQTKGVFSLRAGAGTDVSGGVATGAQIGYIFEQARDAFEVGLVVFGGNFEEDSEEFYTYHEETQILVIGAIASYLYRYEAMSGPYFVAGFGVGAISGTWEESSPGDPSLGTPLPGGGSKLEEDFGGAGTVLNFGVGYRFNQKFDLRASVPTIFIPSGDVYGGATVPTFTLTAGFNF